MRFDFPCLFFNLQMRFTVALSTDCDLRFGCAMRRQGEVCAVAWSHVFRERATPAIVMPKERLGKEA